MEYLVPIALAAGLILWLASGPWRTRRKLAARLQASFGKPPSDKEYDLSNISSYHRGRLSRPDPRRIDIITWNDLDMDRLYRRINVCHSSVGEEYLYSALHEPHFGPEALEERERLLSLLSKNPELRLELQLLLSRLGKWENGGLAGLIFKNGAKPLPHSWMYRLLAVVPLLCAGLIFLNRPLGIASLVLSFIVNMVLHYQVKGRIETQLSTVRQLSSMLACAGKLCRLDAISGFSITKEIRTGYEALKSLRSGTAGILQTGSSDMDYILEYLKILILYDIRGYNRTIETASQKTEALHTLYRGLGELDVSLALLSFRKSLPAWTKPRFHEENSIRFEAMYHPLLKDPVANSGEIGNDSIITGSNASGKSTFIKALAVNGILAQTLNTCAAEDYAPRFSLVITSMSIRDDIYQGDSYFIAEIKSMKRIVDRVKRIPCTCFIDEILRGTNTVERIAASASVLRQLHQADCLCVAASHDIELTDILKNEYDNYHFREQITDDGIRFDYLLKEGPSTTRNAIKLLHFMEFDPAIVDSAETLAEKFDATRSW